MDSELKTKSIIVVLGLAITAIVLSMGLAIAYIWSPKEEKETKRKVLGEYTSNYISEKDIVQKYANEISFLLKQEAYKELYEIVDEDYAKNFGMDSEEKFTEFIKNKGLDGRTMKIRSYQKQLLHGKKYYQVQLSSIDNKTKVTIIIVEYSPNIYKLTFDGFLYETNLDKEYNNNGFKLKVLKENVRADKIRLKVRLENATNNDIIINAKSSKTPIVVKIAGEEQMIRNDKVGETPITLAKNNSIDIDIEIRIEDFKHSYLKGLVIKGVDRKNGETIKNLTFPFYLEK